MIYWIEWQFWSWKTSLATYIAYKSAIRSANIISKDKAKSLFSKSQKQNLTLEERKNIFLTSLWTWKTLILSNIQFNEYYLPNYLYFEDDKFLEVLRTINLLNDIEREFFYKNKTDSTLKIRDRNKFTKFKIFYDEATAIQSARDSIKKDKDNTQEEYIMQNRKNMTDIYIIWADWNQNDKSLRRHVERWFKVKNLPFWLSKLPILKNIWIIERHKKDDEWAIAMEKYMAKDDKGDYIVKQKPIQENIDWFYKPSVWSLYDDLHKNIRDKNKYKINENHLKIFIWKNEKLLEKSKELLPLPN